MNPFVERHHDESAGVISCVGRVVITGMRTLTLVPVHRRLAVGTIRAIYRQASRFIPEEELRPGFFSD